MIKRIFYAVLVSVSLLMFSGIEIDAKSTDCEHTFQIVTIGGVRYLYEYSCDGTLVNVTELED